MGNRLEGGQEWKQGYHQETSGVFQGKDEHGIGPGGSKGGTEILSEGGASEA